MKNIQKKYQKFEEFLGRGKVRLLIYLAIGNFNYLSKIYYNTRFSYRTIARHLKYFSENDLIKASKEGKKVRYYFTYKGLKIYNALIDINNVFNQENEKSHDKR